jgi:uncharacterized damage-inducible protein DinB
VTEKNFIDDAVDLVRHYQQSIQDDFEAIPDAKIWERPIPGQVSSANMMLHLTGNLRHFFGHLLGGSDYRRERDREFLDEPYATRGEILTGWETACEETVAALHALSEGGLHREAPVATWPGGASVNMFVLRLLAHMAYHAGQIRSHYRIFVDPES